MKNKTLLAALASFAFLASCGTGETLHGSSSDAAPGVSSGEPSAPNSSSSAKEESVRFLGGDFSLRVGERRELRVETSSSEALVFLSSDESVCEVSSEGVATAKKEGTATISVHLAGHESARDEVRVEVTSGTLPFLAKTKLKRSYKDLGANSVFGLDCAPSESESSFLVVPIWFTDSANYVSASKKESVRKDIETAFFGKAEETGWESVKSYYEKESFGKFSLSGSVMPWYECGMSVSKVATSFEATERLVKSAYDYVKRANPSLDLRDFDKDGDGFLDAIVLVYAAPDYASLGRDSYSNLWAYCSWLTDESYRDPSSPGPNVFHWASYDFMYGDNAQSRAGSRYGAGDTRYLDIDAHTFIHESGHLLGLEDYYDYSGQYNPAGGFSMQDMNVGGHDPFSILGLNWADPYVLTESTTLELRPFAESGDVALLSPKWNAIDSPFDEYLLVEYYEPTALNAFDAKHAYCEAYPTGSRTGGIRLWHVDARLLYSDGYSVKASSVTVDPRDSRGGVLHMMSNTYDDGYQDTPISYLGSSYADYNILQWIRAGQESYRPGSMQESSLLFQAGDGYDQSQSDFASQFKRGTRLNSGELNPWSFYVESIAEGKATITFTRK